MNGQPTHSETDNHNAYDLIFGSYYVLCQPFKLADNGLQYTFEGKQMLLSKSVYSKKVEYPSTDSLAKPYPWWYYFNADDKTLLAYAIAGKGDRFGLTEFAGFETKDGIRLPSKRVVYMADNLKKPLYQTTVYMNNDVRFFESHSDSIFNFSLIKLEHSILK